MFILTKWHLSSGSRSRGLDVFDITPSHNRFLGEYEEGVDALHDTHAGRATG